MDDALPVSSRPHDIRGERGGLAVTISLDKLRNHLQVIFDHLRLASILHCPLTASPSQDFQRLSPHQTRNPRR